MGRIAPICVIRRPLQVRLRWVDFCRSRYARPVIRMASMRFFESAGAPSTSLFAITMSPVVVIDATRRPRNLLGRALIVPSKFRRAPRACISPTGRAERIRWRKALRFSALHSPVTDQKSGRVLARALQPHDPDEQTKTWQAGHGGNQKERNPTELIGEKAA